MDETVKIANSDLGLRGYSEKEYLGINEVRKTSVYHQVLVSVNLRLTRFGLYDLT
jgi:hypothetical protein